MRAIDVSPSSAAAEGDDQDGDDDDDDNDDDDGEGVCLDHADVHDVDDACLGG